MFVPEEHRTSCAVPSSPRHLSTISFVSGTHGCTAPSPQRNTQSWPEPFCLPPPPKSEGGRSGSLPNPRALFHLVCHAFHAFFGIISRVEPAKTFLLTATSLNEKWLVHSQTSNVSFLGAGSQFRYGAFYRGNLLIHGMASMPVFNLVCNHVQNVTFCTQNVRNQTESLKENSPKTPRDCCKALLILHSNVFLEATILMCGNFG